MNGRVITKNELLLKKEIDKELYSKLMHDNNVCEAFDAGVKYIAIRLRSIKEMRDYLFKKGYLVDVVNEAIQNLINNGYLDDDRFTKAYIKDKMAFTSKGDYKIRMELSNLGIDNGIIDNNILMIDNDMLFNKMKKIIDKDIKNNKKYNGSELRNKIYNHLIIQGYSKEKVINIINTYDF